jgi:phage terminase large subunit GpA-like protein
MTESLVRAYLEALTPPPKLDVDEWADAFRVLPSSSSAEPGPYRTGRTPYAREPMKRLSSSDKCRRVILMWGAQTGKSEIGNNWIGYTIDHDPIPMFLMQPTVKTAEGYSRDRIEPMIKACPALLAKCGDQKSRDGSNTLARKSFPGGFLKIVGSNAPADLASTPAGRAFVDETDRCSIDAGGEGDSIALLAKRLTTFANAKMLLTSTPNIKGTSRIEAEFLRTGQRRYWVPCPHCDTFQPLTWEGIQWDSRDAKTAYYKCEACDDRIYDRHKATMLPAGEWRADYPELEDGEIYGYHLPSLYAPPGWRDASWPSLVREFLDAQQDPKLLKTFTNTRLAETWDEFDGEEFDEGGLMERAEEYAAEVPAGVACLTAGVDVQADRVECEVVGWGDGEESWSIDYTIIHGDPTGSAIWEDLSDHLQRVWHHETAGPMSIAAAGIDCGYETTRVQEFCHVNRRHRWYAVKGSAGAFKPLWPNRGKRGKKGRGEMFFSVGVDNAKAINWRRLQRVDSGPGCMHFPLDRDLMWFQQLVAEAPRKTYYKGRPRQEWVVRGSARSEGLDCRVYALCVLYSYITPNRTLEKLHAALPVFTAPAAARATEQRQQPGAVQVMPQTSPLRPQRRNPRAIKPRF